MDKLVSGRHGRSQHVTAGQVPYCQDMASQGHACPLIAGRPWPTLSGRTWTGLPDPTCSAPQDERMTWFGPVHEKRKAYLILASLHQYV